MQYRKLIELKKLPNNPRTIKDDSFKKLCKSIKDNKDYFEARPLILSDRTGELIIIGGNQRYEAAKSIGLEEVPTYLIENLTEEREKEITIRDNVSNGSWDWDILSSEFELGDLEDWGLDVPDLEIDEEEPEIEEDEVPEVKKDPFVKKGDVWELGTHRLMCGDSTMIDDVEKLMDSEKADMVFTDPPYNLLDHKIETGIDPDDVFGIINMVIKDDCFVAFTGQHPTLLDFMNSIIKFGFKYKNEIIWDKKTVSSVFQEVLRCHENLLIYSKGEVKYKDTKITQEEWLKNADYDRLETIKRDLSYWKSKAKDKNVRGIDYYKGRKDKECHGDDYYKDMTKYKSSSLGREEVAITTIWSVVKDTSINCRKEERQESVHVTQKPLGLITRINKLCSDQGDLVLDLFLGSGSTLIACEQTKRKCFGMELDEHYCSVIITRWLNYMIKEKKDITLKCNGEEINYKEVLDER